MCAIAGGRSVASTMGFTAADGLPMNTRCGNVDPGVILYMMDELEMDARAIEKLIYQQSGLLGMSGISSDMRTLEASNEPGAKAAIEIFVYRIGRELEARGRRQPARHRTNQHPRQSRVGVGVEADVLTQNTPMLAVFKPCGFPMRQRRDSGVVHLTLELNDSAAG